MLCWFAKLYAVQYNTGAAVPEQSGRFTCCGMDCIGTAEVGE
jgi:hypothetical protein